MYIYTVPSGYICISIVSSIMEYYLGMHKALCIVCVYSILHRNT